jgi:hypothetical protein
MRKILIFLILFTGSVGYAQEAETEPRRKWYIPDHMKLQFAGNIGFISGGPGYISRNEKLETDLLFGFLPQKYGGDALVSITLKTTYSPWRIPLKNTYYIDPFSMGIWLSYTFGPQFDTKWPSYYPAGYYWWATSMRPGIYFGGKAGKQINFNKKKRGFEAYYELGTYELKMITYAQNVGTVKLSDIFSLALGVKLAF